MTKATVRKRTALKNRKRRLRKCIMLITFALMACVILGTVLTVKSQSSESIRISDEAYKEFEKEYIANVRTALLEKGFDNSGVTLTKEYCENGTRNYEILIHHKRISLLSQEEQRVLKDELLQIPFPMQGCEFAYEFFERT
ncbi:MAG: hypothetical protein E7299_10745 [Lachnospiraceae bacterium]|nr:hypothetical protein [Lachnospiraceae bacterium]